MQKPSSWVMGVGGQLSGEGNGHPGFSLSPIVKEGVGVQSTCLCSIPQGHPSRQPSSGVDPQPALQSNILCDPLGLLSPPSRTLPSPHICPQVPTPQSPPSIPTPLHQHKCAHIPAFPFCSEAWMSVSQSHRTPPGLPSCEERRTSVYLSHFHFRALLPAAAHNSN